MIIIIIIVLGVPVWVPAAGVGSGSPTPQPQHHSSLRLPKWDLRSEAVPGYLSCLSVLSGEVIYYINIKRKLDGTCTTGVLIQMSPVKVSGREATTSKAPCDQQYCGSNVMAPATLCENYKTVSLLPKTWAFRMFIVCDVIK